MKFNTIKSLLLSSFKQNPELDVLAKFPFFKDFTRHEIFLFNQIMHKRLFKEGDIVYEENFPLAVIYLVEKGIVEINETLLDKTYKIHVHRHQFFGIVDMYNEEARKGNAIVVKDAQLYAISHLDFKSFLNSNPKTGLKLLNNICRSLSNSIYQLSQYQSVK